MQVIKNVIHKLQELQAEGKVHGHLTPAMVKVSDEGLVMVEGTHVMTYMPLLQEHWICLLFSSSLSLSLNHQDFFCGRF